MAKLFKWLMVFLIPLIGTTVTSCGDDNDEPDNPNTQTTVSEEILINTYSGLEFYKDAAYAYHFGILGNGVVLSVWSPNAEGEYEMAASNFKVDGQWVCGMKKYEKRGSSFESFTNRITDYAETPETEIGYPNRGDIYTIYVRTANGDYMHYKILISEPSFNRKNGLIHG